MMEWRIACNVSSRKAARLSGTVTLSGTFGPTGPAGRGDGSVYSSSCLPKARSRPFCVTKEKVPFPNELVSEEENEKKTRGKFPVFSRERFLCPGWLIAVFIVVFVSRYPLFLFILLCSPSFFFFFYFFHRYLTNMHVKYHTPRVPAAAAAEPPMRSFLALLPRLPSAEIEWKPPAYVNVSHDFFSLSRSSLNNRHVKHVRIDDVLGVGDQSTGAWCSPLLMRTGSLFGTKPRGLKQV